MKTLILILALLPTDTLPEKSVLLNAIDSFYQVQTTAQLLEYQSSKKGEWLKYLPTVGMTYTLDGKPRPTISLSSTLLYSTAPKKISKHWPPSDKLLSKPIDWKRIRPRPNSKRSFLNMKA